jgi:hypothetical protein
VRYQQKLLITDSQIHTQISSVKKCKGKVWKERNSNCERYAPLPLNTEKWTREGKQQQRDFQERSETERLELSNSTNHKPKLHFTGLKAKLFTRASQVSMPTHAWKKSVFQELCFSFRLCGWITISFALTFWVLQSPGSEAEFNSVPRPKIFLGTPEYCNKGGNRKNKNKISDKNFTELK